MGGNVVPKEYQLAKLFLNTAQRQGHGTDKQQCPVDKSLGLYLDKQNSKLRFIGDLAQMVLNFCRNCF